MLVCQVKWILWINPVWYVQQALAINEFRAPRWQANLAANGQTVGDATLGQRGLYTEMWWVWLGVGVLVFAQIIFNFLTWVLSATLYREAPAPCILLPCSQPLVKGGP